MTDGLFLDCCRAVASRYSDVGYEEIAVDTLCMQLVLDPTRFDVVLLENLYGDIVSDLCSGLVGGLGVVPGANIGAQAAVFEAVHGSAPDIEDDLIHRVVQAIRAHEENLAQVLLERFKQGLRSTAYAECRSKLVLGAYSILKSFGQVAGGFTFSGIASVVDQARTIDDVFAWLGQEIQGISSKLRSNRSEQKREELILETIEYIKDHLSSAGLNVEEIADHLALSADHVRKLFKRMCGVSLSDYVLKERVRSVQRLLSNTAWSLAEIAERSGFQTRSHFFDAFRRETGETPSQFRQRALLDRRRADLAGGTTE
jgi:AraC-like DNA-binding protein